MEILLRAQEMKMALSRDNEYTVSIQLKGDNFQEINLILEDFNKINS